MKYKIKYKDLNLAKIRNENGLDFAHFTYRPRQNSYNSTPLDMAARHWRNGKKPKTMDNVQYLLFGNARNYNGAVLSTDDILNSQFIYWSFPMEKLDKVCQDLQCQLGDEFIVMVPPTAELDIWFFRKCDDTKPDIERAIKWGMKPVILPEN